MKLTVNGEPHEHAGDGSLTSLLEELEIEADSVAVMVNGNVVHAARRAEFTLSEGDTVEILTFAAGG